MRIGILGSGLMGSKLGTLFARAGHEEAGTPGQGGRRPRACWNASRRDARGRCRVADQMSDMPTSRSCGLGSGLPTTRKTGLMTQDKSASRLISTSWTFNVLWL